MIFPFHTKFEVRIVAFLSYTERFLVIHRLENDFGVVYQTISTAAKLTGKVHVHVLVRTMTRGDTKAESILISIATVIV